MRRYRVIYRDQEVLGLIGDDLYEQVQILDSLGYNPASMKPIDPPVTTKPLTLDEAMDRLTNRNGMWN